MNDQPTTDVSAAVRALLIERRARTFAQARFTASGRRAAWNLIRTHSSLSPEGPR